MASVEKTFQKIKQNRPIQECLNTVAATDIAADIWFIYYMFFAIHNPKMEEYIQKKLASSQQQQQQAHRDIMKNMIKRRNYTSSIVYQLYTYAYTNQGSVTHIYPHYKNDISKQLIKSFQSNHLKTTAVLLRRLGSAPAPAPAPLTDFIEYILSTTVSMSTPESVLNKINNQISYECKDIIILAMICYMKIDEDDINKKNVFITATEEDAATDANAHEQPPSVLTTMSVYDDKYKYLYT
jgi:hypothetical protein